ncbi:hypothetical protein J3458_021104 [Metarhizium acridum]|uniref:uncharacterized protein n=1 Tax=Metarhizium acridum TaxID=92637 RepID=UPI001C6C64B7|nr:hypothetical protein J3458_021104 [Metarhizium acridum]
MSGNYKGHGMELEQRKSSQHLVTGQPLNRIEEELGRLLAVYHDRPTWPRNQPSFSPTHFIFNHSSTRRHPPQNKTWAYKTCRFSEAVPAHLQPSPSPHAQ